MKAKTLVPALIATLSLGAATTATASESAERRASVLRAQAAELRMEAESTRDANGTNPTRAKELDAKADRLIDKANSIDPMQWPPGE